MVLCAKSTRSQKRKIRRSKETRLSCNKRNSYKVTNSRRMTILVRTNLTRMKMLVSKLIQSKNPNH